MSVNYLTINRPEKVKADLKVRLYENRIRDPPSDPDP